MQCFFCHWLGRLRLFSKSFPHESIPMTKVGYLEVISDCRLRSLCQRNQVLEYPQPPLCPWVSAFHRMKSVLLLSTDWVLKCTRRNEKVIRVNLGLIMQLVTLACHAMDGVIWVLPTIVFETEECQSARVHMCDPSLWAQVYTPQKQLQTSSCLYWKSSASNIGCYRHFLFSTEPYRNCAEGVRFCSAGWRR